MIIRHWMTTDVVTINKSASIQEALTVMKEASIRHLPVVDTDMHLTGWVTDADLRGVLIASMLEELTIEDIMVRKPYTTHPDTPLEDAAALILDNRIGGLPVLQNGKLVGVITVVDLLSAFITVMGMIGDSSRLDVKVSSPKGPLDEITRLVQQHNAEVISICHLPVVEGHLDVQEGIYSLRLKKCDLEPIVTDLKKHGIEVVSSIP
ncbi:MAG: CBS domain-containing protein [Syntrophobacteraceae bacterium]